MEYVLNQHLTFIWMYSLKKKGGEKSNKISTVLSLGRSSVWKTVIELWGWKLKPWSIHRSNKTEAPDGVILSAVNIANIVWEENQVTFWNPFWDCQIILKFQKDTFKWANERTRFWNKMGLYANVINVRKMYTTALSNCFLDKKILDECSRFLHNEKKELFSCS